MNISFIVPIYNTPYKILEDCCNSIFNNVKGVSFEVIFVDDGSTINIKRSLEKYLKYPNYKYYKKENGGVSSARNLGLSKSNGDYICFLDPDDRIEFDCRDFNLTRDVYLFSYSKFDRFKEYSNFNYSNYENINKQRIGKKLFENLLKVSEDKGELDGFYLGTPWGKLFKRQFLNEKRIVFDNNLKKRQDAYFCAQVYLSTNNIECLDSAKYYYRIDNNNSITKKYNNEIKKIYIYLFNLMIELCEENKLDMSYELSLYSYDLLKELLNLDFCNINNKKKYLERKHDFLEFRNSKDMIYGFKKIKLKNMNASKKVLYYLERKKLFSVLNVIYIYRKIRQMILVFIMRD